MESFNFHNSTQRRRTVTEIPNGKYSDTSPSTKNSFFQRSFSFRQRPTEKSKAESTFVEKQLPFQKDPLGLYAMLQVPSSISNADLKKAFHKLALLYHPDKVGSEFDTSTLFHTLHIAYDVLSQPDTRVIYDETGKLPRGVSIVMPYYQVVRTIQEIDQQRAESSRSASKEHFENDSKNSCSSASPSDTTNIHQSTQLNLDAQDSKVSENELLQSLKEQLEEAHNAINELQDRLQRVEEEKEIWKWRFWGIAGQCQNQSQS